MYDFIVVGGGIVGLSTAMQISVEIPDVKVLVLEKESHLAFHQTGHNSGVIHSGIYYKPGSYKARFARKGNESMVRFCQEHQIEHDICGKLIVATKREELPLLENLYERGLANELNIKKIPQQEIANYEPYVAGLEAIYVPTAGIVNYKQVTAKFSEILINNGGVVKLNTKAEFVEEQQDTIKVTTNNGVEYGKYLINCGGLYSDDIARLTGYNIDMKIIPFRGEYYKLKPDKRYLVKNLIYPVPNPKFPFLGVHFTRMIDGEVDAGPNAVLGWKKEAYKKTDINVKELAAVLKYKGFWKLANTFKKEGLDEYRRSFSKTEFTKSLQALIPAIEKEDLIEAPAGVRAQAVSLDGKMVDDFFIVNGKRSIHVCNAPSPAATASIEIGKEIVARIQKHFNLKQEVVVG